jgi:dephospho-CoA kinase
LLLVGLTGGIGSGKSATAEILRRKGAVVLDADELARRALEPGTPGYGKVLETFGAEILDASGNLDRQRLASTVFADVGARRALESIVHPEIFRRVAAAVETYRGTDAVLVFDAPLIVESGFAAFCDVLIVVTAPAEVRIARLVERGMSGENARARIAAQAPDEEKEPLADFLIRNDGSTAELERAVANIWPDLRARARGQSGRAL